MGKKITESLTIINPINTTTKKKKKKKLMKKKPIYEEKRIEF